MAPFSQYRIDCRCRSTSRRRQIWRQAGARTCRAPAERRSCRQKSGARSSTTPQRSPSPSTGGRFRLCVAHRPPIACSMCMSWDLDCISETCSRAGIHRHHVADRRSAGANAPAAPPPHAATTRPAATATLGQGVQVKLAEIWHMVIGAAGANLPLAAKHNLFQPRHLLRPECERALRAHLHAGPAIFIVARRDHCDRRTIQRELREVGHGR